VHTAESLAQVLKRAQRAIAPQQCLKSFDDGHV
jgi:hypothetical protein